MPVDMESAGGTASALQNVLALLGTVAAGVATAGAFFHRKITGWWKSRRAHAKGQRDMVSRFPALCESIAHVGAEMRLVNMRLNARSDYSDAAEVEFDADRRLTRCNATLARRLGVGKRDLEGFGYVGHVNADDMAKLRDAWRLCDVEHRPVDWVGRWITQDGEVAMRWRIHPIPDPPEKPIQLWLGVGEFDD